jgi:hypothetical protein
MRCKRVSEGRKTLWLLDDDGEMRDSWELAADMKPCKTGRGAPKEEATRGARIPLRNSRLSKDDGGPEFENAVGRV